MPEDNVTGLSYRKPGLEQIISDTQKPGDEDELDSGILGLAADMIGTAVVFHPLKDMHAGGVYLIDEKKAMKNGLETIKTLKSLDSYSLFLLYNTMGAPTWIYNNEEDRLTTVGYDIATDHTGPKIDTINKFGKKYPGIKRKLKKELSIKRRKLDVSDLRYDSVGAKISADIKNNSFFINYSYDEENEDDPQEINSFAYMTTKEELYKVNPGLFPYITSAQEPTSDSHKLILEYTLHRLGYDLYIWDKDKDELYSFRLNPDTLKAEMTKKDMASKTSLVVSMIRMQLGENLNYDKETDTMYA